MWFIPILVIGAIVVAAASKSPREAPSPPRQLAHPNVAGLPGPISVLGEILRVGQYPAPKVILCAIAEAEAIGRNDLASDIVRAFVAPVVYQHQIARARSARMPYERGSCALPREPRATADYQRGSCLMQHAPRPTGAVSPVEPPTVIEAQPAQQATEAEILAMLHADPQAFLSMVSSRRPPVIDVPAEPPPIFATAQAVPAPVVAPSPPESPVMSPEDAAQMQEVASIQAADQARALAPGSPLGGVSDGAWRDFVALLSREAPTFSSSRHVGQYRQRRERLAELGINPAAIHDSPEAQRLALDADLADAHGHAASGGLLEHLGRMVSLPGHDGSKQITLSGVLGVIQCAGLEGAVGWLERPSDRKRYPHTTAAFLRTNGLF